MRSSATVGVILGLAGAFLDYVSGYLILVHSMMSTNLMGTIMTSYRSSGLAWSVCLFALGTLLLITSIVSISKTGLARMGLFGVLMIVYGIVMLFVGGAMILRITPMMSSYLVSSTGMFVVGALMIINGGIMRRPMM